MKRQNGFTLIELMVVVVIIAVLAGIAYPAYTKHVMKSNRAAAQSVMMQASAQEEQNMLDNRTYQSASNNNDIINLVHVIVPSAVANNYSVSVAVSGTAVPASGGGTQSISQTTPPNVTCTGSIVYQIFATPPQTSNQYNDYSADQSSGLTNGTLYLDSCGNKLPANLW